MKGDAVYLQHILESIDLIAQYVSTGRAEFHDNPLLQDAVARRLQTLAESTQRLSEGLKTEAPSVPWRAIAGLRNVLTHDYLGTDPDILWMIVEQDLPSLRITAQELFERHGRGQVR